MTEATPDQPPGGDPFTRPEKPVIDPTEPGATILDLEQMLSQVKLPEGTAEFCYRGDLLDAYDVAINELAQYVNDQGEPLDEETSLAQGSPAVAAAARVREAEKAIAQHMFRVKFRAMPTSEWTTFTTEHSDSKGNWKPEFGARLITRCAIEPEISLEKAKQMEDTLHAAAWIVLRNRAFNLNRFDGVAVPKSSSSSALLRAQGSSPS